jgi:hypothetical protein
MESSHPAISARTIDGKYKVIDSFDKSKDCISYDGTALSVVLCTDSEGKKCVVKVMGTS